MARLTMLAGRRVGFVVADEFGGGAGASRGCVRRSTGVDDAEALDLWVFGEVFDVDAERSAVFDESV